MRASPVPAATRAATKRAEPGGSATRPAREGAEARAGGAEGQEELDPSGAGGAQELTGVLQDGRNRWPRVRSAGSDDVELPAGTSMVPYRSAEEALTETDLPLDYQRSFAATSNEQRTDEVRQLSKQRGG